MTDAALKKTICQMIGIVGVITVSGVLQAASFDCANTSLSIEKLICSSPAVSNLDEQLTAAYKAALERAINKEALKQQQRTWLKEKRNVCKDPTCLFSVYQQRLGELSNISVSLGGSSQNVNSAVAVTKPEVSAITIPEKNRIENRKLPLTFKLVEGNSYPLCQPYVDMLNKTKYMEYPSCERNLLPEFKQFQIIEWAEVKEKKEIENVLYGALVVEDARYDRLHKPGHERSRLRIKENLDLGKTRLYSYMFDFERDGENETIYKEVFPDPRGPETYRCNVLSFYHVFDKKITAENVSKYSIDKYQMIRSAGQLFIFDGKVINSIWQPIGDYSSIELWASDSHPALCKITVE